MELYPFDAEYLRRLIDGDSAVVSHFVDYITELLTLKLRNKPVDASNVQDVIQDTFSRFWEKLRAPDYIRKPESLGAFVCSICNNVLHERYRDRNRFQQLDPNYDSAVEDDPYLALVSAERCARVRATLDRLSPRDARIIRLIWIEGKSRPEVCKEMAVDSDYLRVLIHRANNEFRNKYDHKDSDHDA